jgi:CheY-like chemotaxis protein/signal transduction histidine kinase
MVNTLKRSTVMPALYFLFACLLSFIAQQSAAAAEELANSKAQATQPSIQSYLYTGPDALTPNKGKQSDNWQLLNNNLATLNHPSNHSLLRVDLKYPNALPTSNYLLELDSNEAQSVDIYQYDKETQELTLIKKDMGILHPFENRPMSYRNITIPLNFYNNGSQIFLFHIEHSYAMKVKFKLWPEDSYIRQLNSELIFFGMIYGSLLMIIIYNLFVYASLREKNHLWFFVFGALSGMFITFQEGHFLQFIAVDQLWPKSIAYAAVTALMCLSFSVFSSYFLDLKRHSAFLNHVLLGVGASAAAFSLLLGSRGDAVIFSPYTLLIVFVLYSVAIAIGLSIWHKGVTSAGFFALAIFLCSFGLFAEFIAHLSFNQFSITNYSLSSIGNTAMLFVFAFALADKMRVLNKEKLEASKKLVKVTEEKAQTNLEVYQSKINEIQLKQEAQSALVEAKAKNEFLSTMGHEIRTPMSGVIGMTELLNDTKLTPDQTAYVESIKNSANALLNVINGLLDYSKIESGGMDLEARVFNLETLIDNCIDLFALSAVEKQLQFTAFVKPNTPTQLKGDSEKLKQITLNLLNSISDIAGISHISLQVGSTGKVSVNSEEIIFTIHVKGIELEKADIESWFELLGDDSEANNSASILNIRVSRQLLELMHGDLSFELNDDGFTLSYNARLLTTRDSNNDITQERSQLLNNRRLLLCHSDSDIQQQIQELSQSWGMECALAEDSKAAADMLLDDNKAFQALIIEDTALTPELQMNIRQSNVNHNFITAVIVINNNQAIVEDDIKKRGIQCLLTPPFTTADLYQSLTQSMGMQVLDDQDNYTEENIHVLVAEDNNINLMVIQGMLKKIGITPDVASNGEEALYRAKSQHYDLIFMDCEMPILDGYEATQAIRQSEQENMPEFPSIIIGLSAHDDAEYKSKAETFGMDDFLPKPINSTDLNTILKQFIDRHSKKAAS